MNQTPGWTAEASLSYRTSLHYRVSGGRSQADSAIYPTQMGTLTPVSGALRAPLPGAFSGTLTPVSGALRAPLPGAFSGTLTPVSGALRAPLPGAFSGTLTPVSGALRAPLPGAFSGTPGPTDPRAFAVRSS
jgi:hypothetical protein